MNNSPLVTEEEQEEQQQQQPVHFPPPPPSRIRSHSLKPRHSREDYARRKSAADANSTTVIRLELSAESNEHEQINTPPPRRTSVTWFQRRFTLFSLEQQQMSDNQQRRMTTGRFSIFDHKSDSNFLKQKRPSIISQIVESFAQRFSIRKKKNKNGSEQDETIIDPVYETLKVAAETRKMTLANYLQQRQQSLNKQASLNSQGSSEHDIQSSPRVSRHTSRTEIEITSSLRPPLPPTHHPSGKRHSTGYPEPIPQKYQYSTRHLSLENPSRDFIFKSSED